VEDCSIKGLVEGEEIAEKPTQHGVIRLKTKHKKLDAKKELLL
jgi:hypothetical protein